MIGIDLAKDTVIIAGGLRSGGKSLVDKMLLEEWMAHNIVTIPDYDYMIMDEFWSYEVPEEHKYFTPKKREIPSSLFEKLLRRIE